MPITDEERTLIIGLAKEGMRRSDIARKLRRGNKTVISVLKKEGVMPIRIPRNPNKVKHMPDPVFFDETAHKNWII